MNIKDVLALIRKGKLDCNLIDSYMHKVKMIHGKDERK